MDRYEFLQFAKDFDDTYFVEDTHRDTFEEQAFSENKTLKEYLSSDKTIPLQWYSQIDYNSIKQLTLLSNDSNPFYTLYNYKLEALYEFFRVLNETNLLLKYFDIYEIDRLRTYNERNELSKKYVSVIDDLKALKKDTKLLKQLEIRQKTLTNTGFINLTKRRIFENFLSKMHNVHLIQTGEEPGVTKQKIIILVNKIIDKYFNEDIKFTKKTNLLKLNSYSYTFETQKEIIVHHRMS